MDVTLWCNGKKNDITGRGYGIRVGKKDRGEYFDKSWKTVLVDIGGKENWVEFRLRDTFWGKCSELRGKAIGKYLIDIEMSDWTWGKPPALCLFPQEGNRFILIPGFDSDELAAIGGEETFFYAGSVEIGTSILYGYKKEATIHKNKYEEMLGYFTGRIIKLGTGEGFCKDEDSLDGWLKRNFAKDDIAHYVGSILINEGYAILRDDSKEMELGFR